MELGTACPTAAESCATPTASSPRSRVRAANSAPARRLWRPASPSWGDQRWQQDENGSSRGDEHLVYNGIPHFFPKQLDRPGLSPSAEPCFLAIAFGAAARHLRARLEGEAGRGGATMTRWPRPPRAL